MLEPETGPIVYAIGSRGIMSDPKITKELKIHPRLGVDIHQGWPKIGHLGMWSLIAPSRATNLSSNQEKKFRYEL